MLITTMTALEHHKGVRNYETQLGIDMTDINPSHVECGDKSLLEDNERLYVEGFGIPVLIYRKEDNVFRIYTNDSNIYLPLDNVPLIVVKKN